MTVFRSVPVYRYVKPEMEGRLIDYGLRSPTGIQKSKPTIGYPTMTRALIMQEVKQLICETCFPPPPPPPPLFP